MSSASSLQPSAPGAASEPRSFPQPDGMEGPFNPGLLARHSFAFQVKRLLLLTGASPGDFLQRVPTLQKLSKLFRKGGGKQLLPAGPRAVLDREGDRQSQRQRTRGKALRQLQRHHGCILPVCDGATGRALPWCTGTEHCHALLTPLNHRAPAGRVGHNGYLKRGWGWTPREGKGGSSASKVQGKIRN